VGIVSGTVHATPSLESSALVIALATSRVIAMSAPGCVQPATGRPVAAVAPAVLATLLMAHARRIHVLEEAAARNVRDPVS
jgi:hypothetical protein